MRDDTSDGVKKEDNGADPSQKEDRKKQKEQDDLCKAGAPQAESENACKYLGWFGVNQFLCKYVFRDHGRPVDADIMGGKSQVSAFSAKAQCLKRKTAGVKNTRAKNINDQKFNAML